MAVQSLDSRALTANAGVVRSASSLELCWAAGAAGRGSLVPVLRVGAARGPAPASLCTLPCRSDVALLTEAALLGAGATSQSSVSEVAALAARARVVGLGLGLLARGSFGGRRDSAASG